jgi:hypothetical protein
MGGGDSASIIIIFPVTTVTVDPYEGSFSPNVKKTPKERTLLINDRRIG